MYKNRIDVFSVVILKFQLSEFLMTNTPLKLLVIHFSYGDWMHCAKIIEKIIHQVLEYFTVKLGVTIDNKAHHCLLQTLPRFENSRLI